MRILLLLIATMAVVGVVREASADLFYEYPDPVDSIEFIYPGNSGPYDAWPFAEENLTQGPGVGFDELEPHDKIGGGANSDWVTLADAGYPADYVEEVGMPVIRLDLGEDVVLDEISTWGYSDTNTNGMREFSLRFATDSEGPEGYGTSIGYNPSFIVEDFFEYMAIERRSFEFDQPVVARYVELTVLDNYFDDPGDGSGANGWGPGGDRVGIGEIAFRDSGLDPGDIIGQVLQAGDANMDLEFNQLDLVQVQIAAKYLTGQAATWGEGDWNGAPGGSPGSPPAGDGLFDQLDIIAALTAGVYLTGPYGAIAPERDFPNGIDDEQTSIVYNALTGEVGVNAPASTNLTSVNIDSASGIFVGHENALNLDGSFDTSSDDNIFKATFGSSFGSLSFGEVAAPGLEKGFVANDLTVVGSLEGGGGLGDVDLIYVPEPSAAFLALIGAMAMVALRRR